MVVSACTLDMTSQVYVLEVEHLATPPVNEKYVSALSHAEFAANRGKQYRETPTRQPQTSYRTSFQDLYKSFWQHDGVFGPEAQNTEALAQGMYTGMVGAGLVGRIIIPVEDFSSYLALPTLCFLRVCFQGTSGQALPACCCALGQPSRNMHVPCLFAFRPFRQFLEHGQSQAHSQFTMPAWRLLESH